MNARMCVACLALHYRLSYLTNFVVAFPEDETAPEPDESETSHSERALHDRVIQNSVSKIWTEAKTVSVLSELV